MAGFLQLLGRHSAILLAISLAFGLLMPGIAGLFRPLLTPSVFVMLAFAMTRVDLSATKSHIRKPGMLLATLFWINIVLPVCFGLAVWIIGEEKLGLGLALAIVLIGAAPPIISSPAMSYLLALNGALSLTFLLLSTALTPLITPAMTGLFIEGEMPLSPLDLAERLAYLIGGSFVVAFILRRFMGLERIQKSQGVFDGLNVFLMIIFAIALMDGIGAKFLEDPLKLLGFIVLAFAFAFGMFALTTAVFWRHDRTFATTIGYSASFRNIALAVGALGIAVPDDTWTMFAMIQFPIYICPLLLKPICRHLLADRS